ncbi:MAG: YeeE/YedE family protein [Terricaulis sp.]
MLDWTSPYVTAALGGALIGASAGGFYLLNGRIAGISGLFSGIVLLRAGFWRWAFVAGLIATGAAALLLGYAPPAALQEASPVLLGVSGVLVGFGTKLSNGCTSGHGVCGLARFSRRSLVAVLVFMTVAALTVYATHHLGWRL